MKKNNLYLLFPIILIISLIIFQSCKDNSTSVTSTTPADCGSNTVFSMTLIPPFSNWNLHNNVTYDTNHVVFSFHKDFDSICVKAHIVPTVQFKYEIASLDYEAAQGTIGITSYFSLPGHSTSSTNEVTWVNNSNGFDISSDFGTGPGAVTIWGYVGFRSTGSFLGDSAYLIDHLDEVFIGLSYYYYKPSSNDYLQNIEFNPPVYNESYVTRIVPWKSCLLRKENYQPFYIPGKMTIAEGG